MVSVPTAVCRCQHQFWSICPGIYIYTCNTWRLLLLLRASRTLLVHSAHVLLSGFHLLLEVVPISLRYAILVRVLPPLGFSTYWDWNAGIVRHWWHRFKSPTSGSSALILIRCLRFHQFLLSWTTKSHEHIYYKYDETGELPNPGQGQPKPKKNRWKVAFGPLFPTTKYFFVGWDWLCIGKQTTRNLTQPNSPRTPYLPGYIVIRTKYGV